MGIGKRILAIRGGTSRKTFAELIGIAENTLRNYEQELSLPNSDVLARICTTCGINIEWLVLGNGPMYRNDEAISASAKETENQVSLDKRILIEVVEEIENWLNADNDTMPAKAKAELVFQMYMLIVEKKADTKQIVQMLSVARSV